MYFCEYHDANVNDGHGVLSTDKEALEADAGLDASVNNLRNKRPSRTLDKALLRYFTRTSRFHCEEGVYADSEMQQQRRSALPRQRRAGKMPACMLCWGWWPIS